MPPFDVCIVGGGIVGLSCARELLIRYPRLRLAIVEKENKLAEHQTHRNSGVIHAGIYYQPGSFRAKLCVEGNKRMYAYCQKKNIPHRRIGKLIVAVKPDELPILEEYKRRSLINKVSGIQMLTADEIRQIEPKVAGLRGLLSPNTGITDYQMVANAYADDVRQSGGTIQTNFLVNHVAENSKGLTIQAANGSKIETQHIIACTGLYSDRFALITGASPYPTIVPFRGTWFHLKPQYCSLVKTNIYPVANPKFPFLGVHFTPTIDGGMLLGPNACLAFSREGYKWYNLRPRDALECAMNRGLQKLIFSHWRYAANELVKELSRRTSVRNLQSYVPSLTVDMLDKDTTSGVRAQALNLNGSLIEDFVFEEQGNHILHVRNAPSPAATSSLAIAEEIANKAQVMFGFNTKSFSAASSS
eukprot:TRINITY_DN120_c1_g1_i1.p1 TRINITY_DN120_c1_g1~~TRINITY_DN120_c1_g1_i1.p1  ORF type:complete len:416 (-),score=68.86 TRINITY_DN120_c1_g1_i1:256-1503(-)